MVSAPQQKDLIFHFSFLISHLVISESYFVFVSVISWIVFTTKETIHEITLTNTNKIYELAQ